ncbi:MAG: hypothetical protein AMK72_08945 [Planctomycetes bacterium SM23_25]|nr:MAG: hypothetical protein AMK72_08945 [Planctomycetes bacterium SM23_25]
MAYLMVIDDDEDFADAAAMVLRSAGHDVQVELDTESASERMKEKPPDLVILDVMFPEDPSAGFKLARAMRQSGGEISTVPILMLTAVNTRFPLGFGPGDIDEAWMPVTDFLEKPVDLGLLKKRVAALLGQSEGPAVP